VNPTVNPTVTPTLNPTAQPLLTVPSAPWLTQVKPGKAGGPTTVKVRWLPPATTGGSPVTSYTVTIWRLDASGRTRRTGSYLAAPGDRSLVLQLTHGRYVFAVTASNAIGDGPRSARSEAVRPR
jgi:hypothetical protein